MKSSHFALVAIAISVLTAAGCGRTPPASFRLNMVEAASAVSEKTSVSSGQALTDAQLEQVATILLAMFGTPDEPLCPTESGLDIAKLREAAGPVRSDLGGRKNGLYREHCVHCHGITGDGLGPTAAFLNPYPRDYRRGLFKYKSTQSDQKPTHADLVRILHNGIPGTSMPSFALLSPPEVDALAEYVKYLAIRGETELALMRAFDELDDEEEGLPKTREFLIEEVLVPIALKWEEADSAVIEVAPMPTGMKLADSIARGRELFHGDKANCVKCHGVTALGDGQNNNYDLWNDDVVKIDKRLREITKGGADAEEQRWLVQFQAALAGDALRPRTVQPRNLRHGIYRGGRRPLDLYYRIHAGIYASQMPALAETIPREDIWHIINYIRSLPYDFDGELGADRAVAGPSSPGGRLAAAGGE